MKISTSTFNLFVLTITLLVNIPQATSCPSIVTDANSCSAAIFSDSGSIVTTCPEDNANVTITGSINITKEFDREAEVTAIPCVSSVYCYEKYAQSIGKFCELVEHSEGDECGTPGVYTVKEVTYPIPNSTTVQSMVSMATIRLLMGYEEACSGAKTAFPWLYSWSILPVAGVAWFLRQRQQRRPLLVLEDAQPSSRFVEMKDVQRIGSMV